MLNIAFAGMPHNNKVREWKVVVSWWPPTDDCRDTETPRAGGGWHTPATRLHTPGTGGTTVDRCSNQHLALDNNGNHQHQVVLVR